MSQQNNNFGGDQNVINQPENVHFYVQGNSARLPPLNKARPDEYLLNYILTILSLISFLFTWIALGLFAKSEFPVPFVWDLLITCIKHPRNVPEAINNKQQSIIGLNDAVLRARRDTVSENSRLNKLDAKIILLDELIKLLYRESKDEEPVAKVLRTLEKKQAQILVDLEPLREKHDPSLYKLRKISKILSEEKLESEQAHECLDRTLNNLIEKYDVKTSPPSDGSISSLVRDLKNFIVLNPENMKRSRLKPLDHTLSLIQWTFSLENTSYSPDFTTGNQNTTASFPEEQVALEEEFPVQGVSSNLYQEFADAYCENNPDLEDITEKPYGYFINEPWLNAINSQIKKLLTTTTDITTEWVDKVVVAMTNEWIYKVSVYGFNREEKAEVELALNIDWDNMEFTLQVDANNKSVILDDLILEFLKLTTEDNMTTDWRVHHVEPRDPGMNRLGFCPASVFWARTGKLSKVFSGSLSRLSIELNFGPDESE